MPRAAKPRPLREAPTTDEALASLQGLTASVEPPPAPATPVVKRPIGRPRLERPVPLKDPNVPQRGRGRPRRQSPPPHPPATSLSTIADGDAPLILHVLASTPTRQPVALSHSEADGGAPVAVPTAQDGQAAAEGSPSSSLRTSTSEAGAQIDRPPAHNPQHRGVLRRVLPLLAPPPLTATPPMSTSEAAVALAERSHWDNTPSLPACLAAIFGWHLASYSVAETGHVRFTLQRNEARVAVEGAGSAFVAPRGASAVSSSGMVRLNGALMPIGACAERLRAAADSGLGEGSGVQTAASSLPPSSSSSSSSPPLQDTTAESSVLSPLAQAPSLMSPNTERHVVQLQARKRARSRSPSPASTSAPSLDASLLSPAQVLAGATDMELPEAPALSKEPQGGPARASSPPRVISELADVKLKTEGTPPSTSPPSPLGTTSDDEEEIKGPTHSRSAVTPTAAALSSEAGAPSVSSPLSRATSGRDTGGSGAPQEKTAAPAVPVGASATSKAASVTGAASTTVIASPTMRQRRVVVRPVAAPSTPESASLSLPSSTAAATGSPPLTASPAVAATPQPRVLFRMPFEFQISTAGPVSAPRDEADADVDSCRVTVAKLRHGTLAGFGFTARSSRIWLAHTHATSCAIASMPPPVPSCRSESGGAASQERAQCTAADSGAAAAAAGVRQLLRQRWLARSSLWAAMEDSLRMAVGSSHLRADPLEAGVLALQAGEEEQQRYDGVSRRAQDTPDVGGVKGDAGESKGIDEDSACVNAAELPGPTFPASRPHALLPVSGRAIVEAQHRLTDAEGEHDNRPGSGEAEPRYTVCVGGIPPAERIAIDHTYSIRGSYLMASTPSANHTLTLLTNPREDLRYHVYKNLLMPDLREAVEAEGTLSIGPDGVGPVQLESPPKSYSAAASPELPQSSGDEDAEDEDGTEAVVRAPDDVSEKASRAVAASNGAEYKASTDIDYILRYRPAIPRIPMPDVESRYGM